MYIIFQMKRKYSTQVDDFKDYLDLSYVSYGELLSQLFFKGNESCPVIRYVLSS